MPHKAALAALTSQEVVRTNLLAITGLTLASLPVSFGAPDLESIAHNLILAGTLVYTISKAADAASQAAKALAPKKRKGKRKKSFWQRMAAAAARFRKALSK